MNPNDILVILMFLTFIVLLVTGFPVAWVLGGVAVIFTAVGYFADIYLDTMTGLGVQTLGMFANRLYGYVDNWVLVSVPMFIFMGLMLDRSAVAEDMLLTMQSVFGRLHGGLAVTVTLIGVILAASTGIIGASVVLLGLISLPVMSKAGYDSSFASGTICAAGCLGILIPPSIMLIIMGDNLGVSVGDLFMAAIFPGLILGGLYIAFILIYSSALPDKAPASSENFPLSWKSFAGVLKALLPPVILVILVLGSISFGIAAPTEASAFGALGTTLIALFKGKLTFKALKEVTYGTFKIVGYIFGIFFGATAFALVLRLIGGDQAVENSIAALPFGAFGVIILIIVIVFFLGFFLDWIEITLIVLPILGPVVSNLQLNIEGYGVVNEPSLVWFVLLVALTLQTSFLTPPMGFALFYLKGVCPPEIRFADMCKGIVPFVILQIITIIIVLFWPSLTTWLPSVVYK
jgi:tripartite ATP-independent transporter DctM subunit